MANSQRHLDKFNRFILFWTDSLGLTAAGDDVRWELLNWTPNVIYSIKIGQTPEMHFAKCI